MYESRSDIEAEAWRSLNFKYHSLLLVMEKHLVSEKNKMLKRMEKLEGLKEIGRITEKQLDELWTLSENDMFSTWKADLKKLNS